MSTKLTLIAVDSELKTSGLNRIGEYKNIDSAIRCVDKEGYIVYVRLGGLRVNKKPGRFSVNNPDTMHNIDLWLRLNKRPVIFLEGQIYSGHKTRFKVICKKCGELFVISWDNLYYGYGCPYCINHKINSDNCLAAKRPDLIKYFEDAALPNSIAPKSNKRISLICPECGQKRKMKAYDLFRNGFYCKFCSDGVSVPEKFVSNLLSNFNFEFILQYSPAWSLNKRYDFFIEDLNLIIETHGEQHYIDKARSRTFIEEQQNDIIKEELAKENGYEYIIIDCRRSSLEWLRENITKQLSPFLNFSEIDWEGVYKKSQNSLCVESWKLWKEGGMTTFTIADKIKINRKTVGTYLKRGTKLGVIDYDPVQQQCKGSGEESYKKRRKPVNQYSLSGEFIREWSSAQEVYKQLGIHYGSVSACALGKAKRGGQFIWRFVNEPL